MTKYFEVQNVNYYKWEHTDCLILSKSDKDKKMHEFTRGCVSNSKKKCGTILLVTAKNWIIL